MTVRIYIRLSDTRDLADVSIERQLQLARDWTSANAFADVVEYIEPVGHRSGTSSEHRPAYQKLMSDLQRGDIIWSYDQSRFTRDDDAPKLLKTLYQRGIKPVFYRDPVNLETSSGRLNVRIKALFNSQYADDISERQKLSWERNKKSGAYASRKYGIGLRAEGKGTNRRAIPSRQGIWLYHGHPVLGSADAPPFPNGADLTWRGFFDLVREYLKLLVSDDVSYREGAKRLREQGYYVIGQRHLKERHERGDPVELYPPILPVHDYHLKNIARQLQNYEGLIDAELLRRARARLNAHAQRSPRGRPLRRDHPTPLLFHALYCYYCHTRFSSHHENWTRGDGQRTTVVYRHSHRLCPHAHKYSGPKLERQFWNKLDTFLNITPAQAHAIESKRKPPAPKRKPNRRTELESKLHILEEMRLDDRITRQVYNDRYDALTRELATLKPEPPQPEAIRLPVEQRVQLILNFVATLQNAQDLDPRRVNLIVRDMFRHIWLKDGQLLFDPVPELEPYLRWA